MRSMPTTLSQRSNPNLRKRLKLGPKTKLEFVRFRFEFELEFVVTRILGFDSKLAARRAYSGVRNANHRFSVLPSRLSPAGRTSTTGCETEW